ncbi:hypothetical protein BJ508DRAFT_179618 [Ascobolus immersus RN42]|uniref:Uncharacterized protein n=1 Tax=Ascobolus immersus RN42 TaxID=1160509 RepID=A0A3N4HYQ1_ASCIM|nr:hypothetical protein BJ508DRAFT_179618 [Ascobolus immersus RN42]
MSWVHAPKPHATNIAAQPLQTTTPIHPLSTPHSLCPTRLLHNLDFTIHYRIDVSGCLSNRAKGPASLLCCPSTTGSSPSHRDVKPAPPIQQIPL